MRPILFFVLTLVCSVSWADWEWTDVTRSGERTWYHDKSTKRRSGSIVRMWTMIDHSALQAHRQGKKFKSAKVFYAFDCREKELAIISIVEYAGSMGGGEVVFSHTWKDNEWDWDPIVPGSFDDQNWKIACVKH